ncbi:MAG: LbtU family siderophore porin [Deltaproteobacteria bacterium]|nr:LbtU family siderophore porin [Deltaproteobacteria bacterium]
MRARNRMVASILFFLLFFLTTSAQALSPETEMLLRLLEKKGIVTRNEVNELRREVSAAVPAMDRETIKAEIKDELKKEMAAETGPLASIQDKVSISGAVEADYQYKDHRDISDKNSDGTSDLFVSTVELDVQAVVNDWTTADVVFIAEDVWKEGGNEDATTLFDQAYVTFQNEAASPFYAVIGKRDLPFGNFFTHTVSDTETYNAYLINGPGATLGYAMQEPVNLDVSLTWYEGEKLISALHAASLGWQRDTPTSYDDSDEDVQSYIARLSITPMDSLTVGLGFDSEPGYTDRNETFNAFAEFTFADFTLDAEYFDATSREKHETDGKSYEEKALVIGLAYQATQALEVAARYEGYDMGHDPDQDGDLGAVFALGANYNIFEDVTLMGEYRRLSYDNPAGSTYEDTVNEYNLRVAVGF